MPYEIKPSTAGGKKGFRVFKKGSKKAYSKEALPKARAEAQLKALYVAERNSMKK